MPVTIGCADGFLAGRWGESAPPPLTLRGRFTAHGHAAQRSARFELPVLAEPAVSLLVPRDFAFCTLTRSGSVQDQKRLSFTNFSGGRRAPLGQEFGLVRGDRHETIEPCCRSRCTSPDSFSQSAQASSVMRHQSQVTDSRKVDTNNDFANVSALITMAEKNDAGVPEGNFGQCSGTLIHEQVFLTAGHCICPGLPAPPPFVRIHVSFSADARDRSTWLPVTKIAGHPSLPPCLPPFFIEAYGPTPVPKMHDVGLAFLAEPVQGIKPARLAKPGSLDGPRANRMPMLIVGFGLLQSIPGERRWAEWDGLRRVRSKSLVQMIDEAWATWALPGEVCNGDSGGPIFFGGDRDGTVVATVSYVGRCRAGSIHARI